MPGQVDFRVPTDSVNSSALSVIDSLGEDGEAEVVPISSLLPADSPRLSGENVEHTRSLQERLPDFPPIIVNRRTMQVVDGMHRLCAAKLQGEDTIKAKFVDTGQRDAFLLAVKANIEHGLPLSLADREAAATRIVSWYPWWSDRAIADVAGLAPKTVGAIRGRSTVHSPQLNTRIGRDGRVRPISAAEGRRQASTILTARPEAPLREVATEAGVSLGTAHDVRERMRRGEDPVPGGQRPDEDRGQSRCGRRPVHRRRRGGEVMGWSSIRQHLIKDPTLRYAESGRGLLRWFDARAIACGDWSRIIDAIPPHWDDAIAGLAYSCADEWQKFARALERRSQEVGNVEALPVHPPARLRTCGAEADGDTNS